MIAWLGTGLLGSAFVRAALRRGEKVQVWNRSGEKARALESSGARAFPQAADAVHGAERVHICLSDDAAVDAVLEQCRGGLGVGVTIVDHSTTSPSGATGRVKQWAAAGYPFQHAPVFMGPKNADDATGFMLASGERALFDKLEPALAPMTGKLLYFGAASGRAAGMKLIGNLFLVAMVAGLTDVLALAKSQDIPPDDVMQLFSKFNPGAMLPARLRRMLEGEFDQPSWNLAMARKDTRLMIEAAQAGQAPLKFIPAVAVELERWLAEGHAADDWTIMARDVIP